MISKYISLPLFLISFAIGLFFVYILGPEIKTIYTYPTLETYMKNLYKDSSNECFQFKPIETKCPINPLSIKTIPIQ
jgi:hypothetical protein